MRSGIFTSTTFYLVALKLIYYQILLCIALDYRQISWVNLPIHIRSNVWFCLEWVAIGYAGTLATGLQCVNGLYRIYDLVENGGGNVAWLDTQEWYVATSTSLDVISLASAGGALKEAVTTWRAMKSISSLKATEWLKSYPRQDRARLTELIIRAQNPGISNKEIKALIRAGLYPKRFPTGPVQVELTRQLGQVVTSAAALAGSAVSGVIAAPSNLPRTGKYIIGTIQSLAVF